MKRHGSHLLLVLVSILIAACGQNTAPPSVESSSPKPALQTPERRSMEAEPAPAVPQGDQHVHAPETDAGYPIPPFYENPDSAGLLPPVLDARRVPPHAQYGYTLAQKNPRLLAQLPCFCYCDRFGHTSLHSCFVTDHAIDCDVCLNEAVEANRMLTEGMSPREIRSVIIERYRPRS